MREKNTYFLYVELHIRLDTAHLLEKGYLKLRKMDGCSFKAKVELPKLRGISTYLEYREKRK